MTALLYVIPWIFMVSAVGVCLGLAFAEGVRTWRLPAAVRMPFLRTLGFVREARTAYAARCRYRAFDRALAQFRRDARVCEMQTQDDIVGLPRD